ncbi:S-adenosyl-L-methionine-dependent methyltransferase [Xylariaceae sp. FL1651]|nr:S-adenosyl-L-methionine-dependent methyltransferase [Xylariaceae sp. FL1651]
MPQADETFVTTTLEATPEGYLDDDEVSLSTDYGEPTLPSWCSLTSSVALHTYEHGRRYHRYKQGHYPIPNDDQEQSREEMKHLWALEILDGRLFLAPIGDHPLKVIDLGTGTGSWAVEVAEKFVGAEVVGVDLSPIQPAFCPPNLQFHVDNVEDEWVYGTNYDFVHLRHMGWLLKDPAQLLKSAFANMSSGGWIEFQDLQSEVTSDDNTISADYAPNQLLRLIEQSFTQSFSFDYDFARRIPTELEKAGFINIRVVNYKVPIGPWARDEKLRYTGWILRETILAHLSSISLKPLQSLGIPQGCITNLISKVQEQLYDPKVHGSATFVLVYGQKP